MQCLTLYYALDLDIKSQITNVINITEETFGILVE